METINQTVIRLFSIANFVTYLVHIRWILDGIIFIRLKTNFISGISTKNRLDQIFPSARDKKNEFHEKAIWTVTNQF